MRGLQRQHVAHLEVAQPLAHAAVLPIEGVSHHRPKGEPRLERPPHQLHSQLELGAEGRIAIALDKVMSRRVGFEVDRIVHPLIGPQARHRHHAVVDLAKGFERYCRPT